MQHEKTEFVSKQKNFPLAGKFFLCPKYCPAGLPAATIRRFFALPAICVAGRFCRCR